MALAGLYGRGMSKLFSLAIAGILVASLSATEPPVVSAVTPSPLVASATAQTVRVTGSGFAPGLTVELTSNGNTEIFSGAAIQGQSATAFDVAVVIAQPGAASLVVRNTDGGVSDAFPLKVEAKSPTTSAPAPQSAPVIARVAPDKATRGSEPQQLTLTGSNFAPALTVTMTDPTGMVTIIKGTSFEAVTPTTVRFSVPLNVMGDYTFQVTNPPGQASNTVTVNVT
jgi:hypothetical protein